jgi:hypothetical protein
MSLPRVEVTRYGGRFWAVWREGNLVAVTVYRKGARAVADLIESFQCQQTNQTEERTEHARQ